MTDALDRFALSAGPISVGELTDGLNERTGAIVTFEGRVRETNEGRSVARLHYDAYPEMAGEVLGDIVRRAREMHPLGAVRVIHRTGTLVVGETAVAVVVAAAHRGQAFDAARFVIETVKTERPVWKREEYEDGSTRWLGEQPTSVHGTGRGDDLKAGREGA
jgi:molybdopterin synthase catalytic subunit